MKKGRSKLLDARERFPSVSSSSSPASESGTNPRPFFILESPIGSLSLCGLSAIHVLDSRSAFCQKERIGWSRGTALSREYVCRTERCHLGAHVLCNTHFLCGYFESSELQAALGLVSLPSLVVEGGAAAGGDPGVVCGACAITFLPFAL